MKKILAKIGDIIEIPLNDNTFAYARVMNDASIQIYRYRSITSNNPFIGLRAFLFTAAIEQKWIQNGKLPITGYDPFDSDDETWPPPRRLFSGMIYYKGEMKEIPKGEEKKYERAIIYSLKSIVDRIEKELVDSV